MGFIYSLILSVTFISILHFSNYQFINLLNIYLMEGMYKVCEVKLTYSTKVKSSERAVIRNSCDAYSLLSGFTILIRFSTGNT